MYNLNRPTHVKLNTHNLSGHYFKLYKTSKWNYIR